MSDKDTISVFTADATAKRNGRRLRELKVDELSANVNLFLEQMGGVLVKTPEKVGKFEFAQFEVHAEVSAKGTLSLMGTGGEAGAAGGIKFVFRRSPGGG